MTGQSSEAAPSEAAEAAPSEAGSNGGRAHLPPSIPAVLRLAADRFGASEAVVDGERRSSFSTLASDALQAARAFAAGGVEPGDRVAIWAPNSYEWIVALLGLQSAGAALVPINTRFKGAEAAHVLNRSGAVVLVTVGPWLGGDYGAMLAGQDLPSLRRTVLAAGDGSDWHEWLAEGDAVDPGEIDARVAALEPESVSDIIFTSGTTGAPKGVVASHGQSIRAFDTWATIVGLSAGDRYLLVNPMFHTFGYKAGILACLLSGATIVPLPVFDLDRVIETIAREAVTVLPGPPTIYQSLLDHPRFGSLDTSSLRLAVTGAAVIPVDLVRRIRNDLGFETVLTAYGLTEATGFVTATRRGDDPETIATTSGRAIDGVEVRVVGTDGEPLPPGGAGEVVCRGFNVMQGYYGEPEQTAAAVDEDGWLHTGDIGILDAAGNLSITDRLNDVFIVGGFNAYPAEIEQLLCTHPSIARAAVVGVPDHRLGEVGVAFVVPAAGSRMDEAGILAWAREHMANFKVPSRVIGVDDLPLNASGKVLKFELRRRALDTSG
jgi:acyl-CoA synthetase (AMP-forming)/AMP-acid ligase II